MGAINKDRKSCEAREEAKRPKKQMFHLCKDFPRRRVTAKTDWKESELSGVIYSLFLCIFIPKHMNLLAGVKLQELERAVMTITNLIFHFGDIYPALVWVDETAVLVYSGYPGQLTQI